MRAWLAAAAIAVFAVGAAHASGVEDGNAGLEALGRGDYREAVRLFTHALQTGDLRGDDQEFAYMNRAKAFDALGDKSAAEKDARIAARLKPDDEEAAQLLATIGQSTGGPRHVKKHHADVNPAPPASIGTYAKKAPQDRWKSLGSFPGSAWIEVGSKPDFYVRYQWGDDTHGSITYTGMDKNGETITGAYSLDPATGKLTGQTTYKGVVSSGDVAFDGARFAEDYQRNGAFIREIYTPTAPGAFQIETQVYQDDAWKSVKTVQFTQVTEGQIAALGWKPNKGGRKFWHDLGASLLNGAAAGVVSGLQGAAPQQ